MKRAWSRRAALALLLASLALPSAGRAAEPPAGGPSPAAAAPGPAGQVEQARLHYERGLQLYSEDNFDAALNEFERAYELAPSYRILYNMARVQRQQNNYAAALRNLQNYLAEGGASVPDERRREVERELETLRARVATVDVEVNVPGAGLYVDDQPACAGVLGQPPCVGRSPLLVNPGRRKISAVKAGYETASTELRVSGSDRARARLTLRPAARAEAGSSGGGATTRAVAAWAVTGAVAVGAAVTGAFTLDAQRDLRRQRDGLVEGGPAALDDDSRRVKNLALATDVLGGVAIVGGVVSTILTIKAASGRGEAPPEARGAASALRFDVGPAGAALSGRF
jgi:Tetratricopeptide repeat